MTTPFEYPESPLKRRHNPQGYRNPESYRDWLRDEFSFRCTFCLLREKWVPGGFHLDHFVPRTRSPDRIADYGNLLYCCGVCNVFKTDTEIPDPTVHLLRGSIQIDPSGKIIATSHDAALIIESIGLNRPSYQEFRRTWIQIAECVSIQDSEIMKLVFGYPSDLPDLTKRRPPGGNLQPEGIVSSHYSRRERGELPRTYR